MVFCRARFSRGDPMRRIVTFVLAGLVATAVGCSGSEKVATTPASSSPTSSAAIDQPLSAESPSTTPLSRATSAAVGDTLNLTGQKNGETLAVTVVKVVDPAVAENDYSTPGAGKRFVAVQFRLKNTGTEVYSDSPSNGAKIVDTQGQQFASTIEDTTAGPGFPGSVTIARGDTGLGFITFAIPASSKVAKVQFTMDSGFADNTGQWDVPGRH
ncbi:protein of unknown function DUF1942 [Actinobacteria bacterium OK074]|nr:protein of unknown function DUF1942 [Actinobacteria bacterium OK074]